MYLEVTFCTLGTTLLRMMEVSEPVVAPALPGAVLVGVASRSRKKIYAIVPRISEIEKSRRSQRKSCSL